MENNDATFLAKLDEVKALFDDAIQGVILCENRIDKVLQAPHNEMRSALYHIMAMLGTRGNKVAYEHEFDGARSHILRAGYDAYEMLCIKYVDDIKSMLADFSAPDISSGFPAYYQTIKPDIEEVELHIAKIRKVKAKECNNESKDKHSSATLTAEQERYIYYLQAANKLCEYVKQTNLHISSISDFRKANKREKLKQWAGWFVALLVTIALGLLSLL